MGNFYIFGTIVLTVYGQRIIKWKTANAGFSPADTIEKIGFLLRLMLNPWILSSLTAAFLAFFCWLEVLTKFELSYAYPLMSLAFVLVLGLSAVFFHEPVTGPKVAGVILIIAGIIVGSTG